MLSTPSRFRDPVCGFLHFSALLVSLVAGAALAWACREDATKLIAVSVYALSMIGCFVGSSLHHLVRGERATELRLLKWDHALIYPFIAGSYTPVCLFLMPPAAGHLMLGTVWFIALTGFVYKLFFAKDPESVEEPPGPLDTALYVAMGCLILFQVFELAARSKGQTLGLAVAGGVAYIVGAVILSRKLLDFYPGRLGHHEIWHLCVIAGAACMYAFIYLNLV